MYGSIKHFLYLGYSLIIYNKKKITFGNPSVLFFLVVVKFLGVFLVFQFFLPWCYGNSFLVSFKLYRLGRIIIPASLFVVVKQIAYTFLNITYLGIVLLVIWWIALMSHPFILSKAPKIVISLYFKNSKDFLRKNTSALFTVLC